MTPFEKDYGPLKITEAAGTVTIASDESAAVGGGSVAGVVKASGKGEVDIEGAALIDAGLALAAAKYPALAPAVAVVKEFIDAELAKV